MMRALCLRLVILGGQSLVCCLTSSVLFLDLRFLFWFTLGGHFSPRVAALAFSTFFFFLLSSRK